MIPSYHRPASVADAIQLKGPAWSGGCLSGRRHRGQQPPRPSSVCPHRPGWPGLGHHRGLASGGPYRRHGYVPAASGPPGSPVVLEGGSKSDDQPQHPEPSDRRGPTGAPTAPAPTSSRCCWRPMHRCLLATKSCPSSSSSRVNQAWCFRSLCLRRAVVSDWGTRPGRPRTSPSWGPQPR